MADDVSVHPSDGKGAAPLHKSLSFLIGYGVLILAVGIYSSLADRLPACPLLELIDAIAPVTRKNACYRLDVPILITLAVLACLGTINFYRNTRMLLMLFFTLVFIGLVLIKYYVDYVEGVLRISMFSQIDRYSFVGAFFIIFGMTSASFSAFALVATKTHR